MFEVLYKPFPDSLQANIEAHVVLVWTSFKGQRILVQALSREEENRKMQREWYENTAEALNNIATFEFTRLMLRSIKETWQQSDHLRALQEERMLRTHAQFFGADFGRLDFGRPGRGGSGVDGYW